MTFRSVHHPGAVARPWLALQAQARPVALALLAVMTVGLAAALEGQPILWPFVISAAAAYALAASVAQYRLTTLLAQIEVAGAQAAPQSVWQAAAEPVTPPFEGVSSARLAHGELTAGIGDTVVSFERADWPEFDALVEALRGAARESEAELLAHLM